MTKILVDKAVIEQALDALFMYKPIVTGVTFQHGLDATKALRAVLEQPQVEQEPVAWMDTETRILYDHDTNEVDQHHGFKPTVPLYTRPQPPRQPLTDEQIICAVYGDTGGYSYIEFARAIEAAHGIGGEA